MTAATGNLSVQLTSDSMFLGQSEDVRAYALADLLGAHVDQYLMWRVLVAPANPDSIALSGGQQRKLEHYSSSSGKLWLRQMISQSIYGANEAMRAMASYLGSPSASRGQRRSRSSSIE